ncbi:C1 family peptidase [Patescibacteria group bacterium]|nr:C1 family peptidase [Patescibacteria group bacterium]
MGDNIEKNTSVKTDFRSWLVIILGIIVLTVIANYVYKTIPGSSAAGLPPVFDWRNYQGQNWMTSVKDQGDCGACGVFGTVGAMEAIANIEADDPNLDLNLSEQHVVSCAKDDTCEKGTYPGDVLGFIRTTGIVDEVCFPYVATSGNCGEICSDWEDRLAFIQSYSQVPFDNNYSDFASPADYNIPAKGDLIEIGPLAVSMQFGGTFFGDIYVCPVNLIPSESSEPDPSFHTVTMVGYNDIEEYWIMKNQWGSDWPPATGGGYFKVAYGSRCTFRKVWSMKGVTAPDIATLSGRKIRLTNDSEWDGDPVVRDNQIVWSKGESDGSELDVYYLKVPEDPPLNYIPVPIAITDDDIDQITPTICGNTIYYSQEQEVMYVRLLADMPGWSAGDISGPYELCTDEMRVQRRCAGYGYQIDCSDSAVTFVSYDSLLDSERVKRFDLNDSLYYKEKTINSLSVERQPPPDSDYLIDPSRRPQITEDGWRIVYSERIEDYMLEKFQAYYYDGVPPQTQPPPPPFPDFPKFVDQNNSVYQYHVDVDGNTMVWAQAEMYGSDSNIHIKNIVSGYHVTINRPGAQYRPVISGNWIAYFDGPRSDIMLYSINSGTSYAVTDPEETSQRNIHREYLDFQGDTIVWNEMSDTEDWDIYMFKFNPDG